MRTSQIGDRVQAHYTKRFTDGSSRSSRIRGDKPLELIVGTKHPRLPGVTSGLVGLAEGNTAKIYVSAEEAFGRHDPARIFRVDRARFNAAEEMAIGKWVSMHVRRGLSRRVRILEVHGRTVVIDANHPRCGQSVELEVELVAILPPSSSSLARESLTPTDRKREV
jgi:peptidylprolyl isomerase